MKVLESLRQTAANPDGLIFSKPDGQPIDPDFFDALFEKVRTKAKMTDVRFHDLRHFFASMLIAQGENPKYICDQLGQSSVQVTFDIYGHLFPTARQEAAQKFQEAMRIGSRKLVAEDDLGSGLEEKSTLAKGRVN